MPDKQEDDKNSIKENKYYFSASLSVGVLSVIGTALLSGANPQFVFILGLALKHFGKAAGPVTGIANGLANAALNERFMFDELMALKNKEVSKRAFALYCIAGFFIMAPISATGLADGLQDKGLWGWTALLFSAAANTFLGSAAGRQVLVPLVTLPATETTKRSDAQRKLVELWQKMPKRKLTVPVLSFLFTCALRGYMLLTGKMWAMIFHKNLDAEPSRAQITIGMLGFIPFLGLVVFKSLDVTVQLIDAFNAPAKEDPNCSKSKRRSVYGVIILTVWLGMAGVNDLASVFDLKYHDTAMRGVFGLGNTGSTSYADPAWLASSILVTYVTIAFNSLGLFKLADKWLDGPASTSGTSQRLLTTPKETQTGDHHDLERQTEEGGGPAQRL